MSESNTVTSASDILAALNAKNESANDSKSSGPNEYFNLANDGIEVYVQTAKGAFIKASTIRRSPESYAKHPIQEKLIEKALKGEVDDEGYVELTVKIKVVAGISSVDVEL